ncbi:hypothetical protein PSPTOT1_3994 [Pseudomonas syringae pv. tomato T1]|nr:hypothetical protein PSPTOT1_3994 [Pseudomonas syringae pv. tomato T1]
MFRFAEPLTGTRVQAVGLVVIEVDYPFIAQALEYFAHAQKRQRHIQPQQLAVHTAHAQWLTFVARHQQRVQHLEPNQAGAQAKTFQQQPDVFVAGPLGFQSGRLCLRSQRRLPQQGASRDSLAIEHPQTPFQAFKHIMLFK